jgi:acetyl esterase/lipase
MPHRCRSSSRAARGSAAVGIRDELLTRWLNRRVLWTAVVVLTLRRALHRRLCSSFLVALLLCIGALSARAPASQGQGELSQNSVWGRPSAAFQGKPPRGWVVVIHAGGWQFVGPSAVRLYGAPFASYFNRHGWGTYDIDYRPRAQSLGDVLASYDQLRRRVGAKVPVCAFGGSAGGHLALMLAAYRRSLNCVITEAAFTNLVTFPTEPAWPINGNPLAGPEYSYEHYILASFGSKHLSYWSPVRHASTIRAHILMGSSQFDSTVPQ